MAAKKTTKPKDPPSYANGGIQYTGQGATPAAKKNIYSTTEVRGITKDDKPVSATPSLDGVQMTRTATGINRLKFPDGRDFQNLTNDQVQTLMEDWKNRPISQEQQIQAEIDRANLKERMIAEQTPPNATSEQLASVGNYREEYDALYAGEPDAVTSSIVENVRKRELVGQGSTIDPLTGESLPFPIINKITGVLPGGKFKNAVINSLSNTPEGRAYITDYSNEDNYDAIIENVKRADENIGAAKDLAAYGYSTKAIKTYNEALAEKQRARIQLKMIADTDQRAYTTNVRMKQTELENYFEKQKQNDDLEMQSILLQSKQINGGME